MMHVSVHSCVCTHACVCVCMHVECMFSHVCVFVCVRINVCALTFQILQELKQEGKQVCPCVCDSLGLRQIQQASDSDHQSCLFAVFCLFVVVVVV